MGSPVIADALRHLPEHPIVNLVGKVNRFLDGFAGGYHTNIHLPLPSESNPGNETRAEIDHSPIDSGHVRVGVEHLPASGPLLPGDELVGVSEEDFGGQVSPQFAAQGALDLDGLKGELPDAGWNVAAASFAGDHECLAARGGCEHGRMIGEK
jgi:hypothetical protein